MEFTGCGLLLQSLALYLGKERFTNFEAFASKETEIIDCLRVSPYFRQEGGVGGGGEKIRDYRH